MSYLELNGLGGSKPWYKRAYESASDLTVAVVQVSPVGIIYKEATGDEILKTSEDLKADDRRQKAKWAAEDRARAAERAQATADASKPPPEDAQKRAAEAMARAAGKKPGGSTTNKADADAAAKEAEFKRWKLQQNYQHQQELARIKEARKANKAITDNQASVLREEPAVSGAKVAAVVGGIAILGLGAWLIFRRREPVRRRRRSWGY